MPASRVELAVLDALERRRVGIELDRDPVDVMGPGAAIEAVALHHDQLAGNVLRHVVRGAGLGRGAFAPSGSAGSVGGTAHRPAQTGGQVRHRLRQPQPQDSSLRDGSGKRRGLAGEHPPGSEDVHEGTAAGLHRRREDALERPDECLRRRGRPVREAGVLPDREGVRPPVFGDRRVVLCQLGCQLEAAPGSGLSG